MQANFQCNQLHSNVIVFLKDKSVTTVKVKLETSLRNKRNLIKRILSLKHKSSWKSRCEIESLILTLETLSLKHFEFGNMRFGLKT